MERADYDRIMLALTMWREARGEPNRHDDMRAVGHVIRNRVLLGWGDWDHVMTKKWQFSSLTAPGDSQLVVWPDSPDAAFDDAMQIADVVYDGSDPDNTNGATHYFNPNVVLPSWAAKMTKVVSLDHHDFYR